MRFNSVFEVRGFRHESRTEELKTHVTNESTKLGLTNTRKNLEQKNWRFLARINWLGYIVMVSLNLEQKNWSSP